jgi:predicted nucleic acid-binding protein
VKNITVSLPDELYRKARIKAAERNTSLSAMVKQFLESLAKEEGEFKRLERLQEESYAQIERFQTSNRLTREELYWDAAIIEAARSLGCSEVLTEDLQDQQDFGGINAVNPF